LSDNYEPFKKGVKKYIPLDEKFDQKSVEHLKAIFDNPDKQEVLTFIAVNNILPKDLIAGLQSQVKRDAIDEFEKMLELDLIEQKWQEWFKQNN
jgi:hypothetical protein